MAYSKQIQRLQQRLDAIPVRVREAVKPALQKSAEELAGDMRQLAPVDEGDLRDSIHVTLPGQSTPPYSQPGGMRVAGDTEAIVTVGNEDTRYPHLVEYGTAHAAAQPFFWPAFRLNRIKLQRRIKRAIAKAVRNEAGND